MTKQIARFLVAVSALVLTAGPLAGSASAATSGPHVYKQADSGRTVGLTYGSKLKVRLKVCEDCGDRWSFAHRPDAKTLKLVHKTDVSSATPPAVGGINTVTWTFKGVGYGKTTLKLVKRSASQGQKVTKRFSLTVNVHEALVVD